MAYKGFLTFFQAVFLDPYSTSTNTLGNIWFLFNHKDIHRIAVNEDMGTAQRRSADYPVQSSLYNGNYAHNYRRSSFHLFAKPLCGDYGPQEIQKTLSGWLRNHL